MKNDELKGEDAGFAINGGRGWKVVELTLTLSLTPTPTATLALALALTLTTAQDERARLLG